jgi:hypothetical protein
MSKKISVGIIAAVILLALLFTVKKNIPITLGPSGALPKYSIDDKINRAELILIGKVTTNLPSQWMGPNGSDPRNASPEEVARARGLFTDSMISIQQMFKGDIVTPVVRIRAFTGQTERVVWSSNDEPSYIKGRTYLLFLKKDHGPTANISPGDYIAVGAFQGVYEIINGRAVSQDDEWDLEELIAYIQNKLTESTVTPALEETPDSTETSLPVETEEETPTP